MAEDKKPVGRPPKLTEVERKEVLDAFANYISETADPTIPKFVTSNETALEYDVTDDNLQDWTEFSSLRKRATKKQESFLLEQGGAGKYNPTIAIFRLKQPQHGYKDRIDSDITSGGEKLEVGLSANQAEQLIRARAARESSDT